MFSISLTPMIRKILPLFFVFAISGLTAKANFDFDTNCVAAYHAILSLKMNEARELLQREKQQNPQNGIVVLLENYEDYFSLLASESKDDYEKLKDRRSERISALEGNDENSPFYLYSQAQVYLQWSFLKAKFGDYFSSGMDARRANGLLTDNEEKYPGFLPDKVSLALVNVIFGSIPASFKSISRFFGMSGNTLQGVRQLEALKAELARSRFAFYNNEVNFFIATIGITVLHEDDSYNKLESYLAGMDSGSLLKSYLQGFIAYKSAQNDDAIKFLEAAPKSEAYIRLPAVDYLLGCARLNRLDNEQPTALIDFLHEYRGRNYIKDAYMKLAYYYLLHGYRGKYDYFVRMTKTHGYSEDEKDKQALWEADDTPPDLTLLKARFYFDGGYYEKALAELTSRQEDSFKLQRDRIEWYYRLGRVYDKTDKLNEAITNYQKAIALGRNTKYYYSANAALCIGQICERRKDYNHAAAYYSIALGMHDHQYQTDIDNDAHAGLKRIGH